MRPGSSCLRSLVGEREDADGECERFSRFLFRPIIGRLIPFARCIAPFVRSMTANLRRLLPHALLSPSLGSEEGGGMVLNDVGGGLEVARPLPYAGLRVNTSTLPKQR